MNRYWIKGMIAGLMTVYSYCMVNRQERVDLQPVQYDMHVKAGWRNIFLHEDSMNTPELPAGWRLLQQDYLCRCDRFEPVILVKARIDTTVIWAADVNHDNRIDVSEVLSFRRCENGVYTRIPVTLAAGTGEGGLVQTGFDLLRTDDGYVYARIGEYRTGTFHNHRIELHLIDRHQPLYRLDTRTHCFLDVNGDGEISTVLRICDDGQVIRDEAVSPDGLCILDKRKYLIQHIDERGETMTIAETCRDTAAYPGFIAPAMDLTDLADIQHRLEDYKGRPVLILFWSVHCYHLDSVFSALGELRETIPAENVVVIAVPVKHEDPQQLLDWQQDHSLHADIMLTSDQTITSYNPQRITPLLYSLDDHLRIEYSATGAHAVCGLITWCKQHYTECTH
ncbi:redoxin domain-containing protein [bacterium]|nr:redoxin domain-containing protein [bacterium]